MASLALACSSTLQTSSQPTKTINVQATSHIVEKAIPTSAAIPTAAKIAISTVTRISDATTLKHPQITSIPGKTHTNTSTSTITLTSSPTLTTTPTETPTPSAMFGKNILNMTYCTMAGRPQELDMYFPTKGDVDGPWPIVVYIHGGGWAQGDKTQGKWLANLLNPSGYIVVLVNYRMYPDFYFPAFIEDPKCAVRFLRAHAERYSLDPNRIAAWGSSAGGHLVMLLGTTDKEPGWDVGEYPDQSSRVQAVVNIAGPADLSVRGTPKLEPLMRLAFNALPEGRLPYSPIIYASADDPPFFIVQGDQDDVVPLQQSESMYNALTQAGVSAQLVIIQNGAHPMVPAGAKPMNPTPSEVLQMAYNFLEAILKE